MTLYVPEAGDVVWLEFDPQAGHEQSGRRPALVISPSFYNQKSGLMVCCPITSQIKKYPFEVLIDIEGRSSAVLSDQVKSLDWRTRRAKKIVTASEATLAHVRGLIRALLEI